MFPNNMLSSMLRNLSVLSANAYKNFRSRQQFVLTVSSTYHPVSYAVTHYVRVLENGFPPTH